MVCHRRGWRADLVDGMRHRVAQKAPNQLVDAVVEGRGEQQPLTAGRCRRQDAGDTWQETQIRHVIGLVEHADLDCVEADQALFHQVFEPAGAGHHDVDTAVERGHLPALGDAAEDRGDCQPVDRRQRFERRADLAGQFTRRRQYQPGRPRRASFAAGEPGHQRNREGQRLPAACLCSSQHVVALEGVGQGVDLNREWRGDTERGERPGKWFAHAEVGKRCGHRRCLSGMVVRRSRDD